MSGSMKWFVYQTDDGADFAIWRDESRVKIVNGETGDYVAGETLIYGLPRNVTPRTVRYSSSDGTVSASIVALTQSLMLAAPAQFEDVNTGKTLTRRSRQPEKVRLPYAEDTGLNDGTPT